jgi:3-oxoacid CoA-transferase A subunit
MAPSRLDSQSVLLRAANEVAPGNTVAADGPWSSQVEGLLRPELGAWFLRDNGLINDVPLSNADAAAVVRGGYVDVAIVDVAQVDSQGNAAGYRSRSDIGLGIPGNAVDLAANSKRVVAMLPFMGDAGSYNLAPSLTLPVDAVRCVDKVITDVGVFGISSGEFVLTEVAPGWSANDVLELVDARVSVSPALREMDFSYPDGPADNKIYQDGPSALADVPDGATVFIDGFGGPGGMAHYLLIALRDLGSKGLTIVSNTAGIARVVSFGTPPGKTAIDHSVLIENGQVAKAIASFPVSPSVSRPSEFELAYRRGEVDLELVPQGTLAERLRAGGAGVHAFYTPTGAGTLISEGKEQKIIDGREYVLEYGLRADFAIIRAYKADTVGNLVYRGTSRNFNAVMAPAARTTIVEVDEIVGAGTLDPEEIVTPGVFVQRIVKRPDGFTGYE